jgi:hypothetical protein
MEHFYYNEFSAYIPKFEIAAFTNVIINGDFEFCPGIGYAWEEVEVLLNMSMKFNDCYKNILTDVCEFNADWKGYESKYLEECDLSNDSLIELVNWTIVEEKDDIPTIGTTSPISATYCYALPLISEERTYSSQNPINVFAKIAYSRLIAYLQ